MVFISTGSVKKIQAPSGRPELCDGLNCKASTVHINMTLGRISMSALWRIYCIYSTVDGHPRRCANEEITVGPTTYPVINILYTVSKNPVQNINTKIK